MAAPCSHQKVTFRPLARYSSTDGSPACGNNDGE